MDEPVSVEAMGGDEEGGVNEGVTGEEGDGGLSDASVVSAEVAEGDVEDMSGEIGGAAGDTDESVGGEVDAGGDREIVP